MSILGPGMASNRRCACGALLMDDREQCIDCRPALSAQAKAIGAQRRLELEALHRAEIAIEGVEALLTKLHRKTHRRW
jgi:hypothetical protein